MRHFGSHHSGESAGSGSGSVTSSAAPRIRPSRERVGKRSAFNGVAAARVDDDGVRFERCDAFRIEQMVRCRVDGTLMAITSAYCSTLSKSDSIHDVVDALGLDAWIATYTDGFHADGLAESGEMRPDVSGTDHKRGFAVRSDGPACIMPYGISVSCRVDVQVLHDAHMLANICSETLCPYAPVALVSIDPVGALLLLVFVDSGTPGLQPFEFGALRIPRRDVAR